METLRKSGRSYNSVYIQNYYRSHPGKRQENRVKDAIRLLEKNGYVVIPQSELGIVMEIRSAFLPEDHKAQHPMNEDEYGLGFNFG